jgi:hypothetical protein
MSSKNECSETLNELVEGEMPSVAVIDCSL